LDQGQDDGPLEVLPALPPLPLLEPPDEVLVQRVLFPVPPGQVDLRPVWVGGGVEQFE
jgi:hypothetical protein